MPSTPWTLDPHLELELDLLAIRGQQAHGDGDEYRLLGRLTSGGRRQLGEVQGVELRCCVVRGCDGQPWCARLGVPPEEKTWMPLIARIQGFLGLFRLIIIFFVSLCCVATCTMALECRVLFPDQTIMDRCVAIHSSGKLSTTQIVIELLLAPAQRAPVVYCTCAYKQIIHLRLYNRETYETTLSERLLLIPP